jgi:hypothetical protein
MRLGVALLPPIVNAVAPLRFTREESRRLRADPPDLPPSLRAYAAAGRFGAERQRIAEREIRRLGRGLAARPICLPIVPARSFALPAVEQLAHELEYTGRGARRRSAGGAA